MHLNILYAFDERNKTRTHTHTHTQALICHEYECDDSLYITYIQVPFIHEFILYIINGYMCCIPIIYCRVYTTPYVFVLCEVM